jgi:hypothetical protein
MPVTPRHAAVQHKYWNKDYYPYSIAILWPILRRPDAYQWVMDFDPVVGGDPHSTAPGGQGNLDLDMILIPSYEGQDPDECKANAAKRRFVYSILRKVGQENIFRDFVYSILRKVGQENIFRAPAKDQYNYQPPLMPLLCGDNPLENTLPSKFLRLTDTQLFILQQWDEGKFINEKREGLESQIDNPPPSGSDIDRGVLWNALGGAFCPGGEVCWIIRNPAIYAKPYRIKHSQYTPGSLSQPEVVSGAETPSKLADGLEPGDLTKYGAVPWQSDFNECASQDIDVTYEGWVNTYSQSTGTPATHLTQQGVFWWPAHRPIEVFLPDRDSNGKPAAGGQVPWTRTIPVNNAGDLAMVTAWTTLGFVRKMTTGDEPSKTIFVETERNDGSDKLPLLPPEPKKP